MMVWQSPAETGRFPFVEFASHAQITRGDAPWEPSEVGKRHSSVSRTLEENTMSDDNSSGITPANLEALYVTDRDRMVRFALLLVGSRPIAEDLVQDAFVRMAHLKLVPENAPAYLRITVANLSRSHLRRRQLERRTSSVGSLSIENPEIDETWNAVRRLPFRQRAVVVLRFYEDYPEADIAEVLGCRLGTVKSSLHRALARLRKELM